MILGRGACQAHKSCSTPCKPESIVQRTRVLQPVRKSSGSAGLHALSHQTVKLPAQILSPSARAWTLISQKASQALLPVQAPTSESCDHELLPYWRTPPSRQCWPAGVPA